MTIKARINKINEVANAAQFVSDNGKGQKVYFVKSTRTDKPYQVFAQWLTPVVNVLRVKVQLYTYDYKERVNGRGNHQVDWCKTTVCYQALGALKAAAKLAGKVLSICENYQNAVNLLNFGGKLVKIENLGQGVVWGTVR